MGVGLLFPNCLVQRVHGFVDLPLHIVPVTLGRSSQTIEIPAHCLPRDPNVDDGAVARLVYPALGSALEIGDLSVEVSQLTGCGWAPICRSTTWASCVAETGSGTNLVIREGGIACGSSGDIPGQRGYRSASWRGRRGPTFPAPHAGRHLPRAGGSRSCAGGYGGSLVW